MFHYVIQLLGQFSRFPFCSSGVGPSTVERPNHRGPNLCLQPAGAPCTSSAAAAAEDEEKKTKEGRKEMREEDDALPGQARRAPSVARPSAAAIRASAFLKRRRRRRGICDREWKLFELKTGLSSEHCLRSIHHSVGQTLQCSM